MSKYIDETVSLIKNNLDLFKPIANGIKSETITISGYGNTRPLSICDIYIDGVKMQTTYIDCWKLESIVGWYYRNSKLKNLYK